MSRRGCRWRMFEDKCLRRFRSDSGAHSVGHLGRVKDLDSRGKGFLPLFRMGTLLGTCPFTNARANGSTRYPASTADRWDPRASKSVSCMMVSADFGFLDCPLELWAPLPLPRDGKSVLRSGISGAAIASPRGL